ncbi:hypothetical protein V1522DRAFT_294301 [Lipomyces starkeyi]
MMRPWFFLLIFVPAFVHTLAPTDEIQDADPAQSGYLPNHNMHLATVRSSEFRFLWKNAYGVNEKWHAKPLVYTPPGKGQLVFLASSANIIRTSCQPNIPRRSSTWGFMEASSYACAPRIQLLDNPRLVCCYRGGECASANCWWN